MSFLENFWKNKDNLPTYVQQTITLNLAKQIEDLMESNNISEQDLARKIGKTKLYVISVLRGDINLDTMMLAKIAIALNANIGINLTSKTK